MLMMFRSAPVRLVGGSTYGEGRVNIYNDATKQWMPVCASGWTMADADVATKQWMPVCASGCQSVPVDAGLCQWIDHG